MQRASTDSGDLATEYTENSVLSLCIPWQIRYARVTETAVRVSAEAALPREAGYERT